MLENDKDYKTYFMAIETGICVFGDTTSRYIVLYII